MKVISVIEDEDVIKKILKHLGLWERKTRPPPKTTSPENTFECNIDYSSSQLPSLHPKTPTFGFNPSAISTQRSAKVIKFNQLADG
jgi:hypothetical protein